GLRPGRGHGHRNGHLHNGLHPLAAPLRALAQTLIGRGKAMRRASFWSWLWIVLGILYFAVPLASTFIFSLRAERGTLSLTAHRNALADPQFIRTFTFSVEIAILTIVFSLLLIVPTVYWVHLKLPQIRPF